VAAARNHGVSIAQADLIAFLDSDDLWMPSKLHRQCSFMRDHREYRIAQCQEIWIRQGKRVNPGVRHSKRSGDIFVDSLRTCLLSPSAVIMTAELFAEMQGFDEAMEACEDYDLWLRISLAQSVGLMNEKLVTRRAGHPGQLSAIVPALDRFRIRALLKILASGRVNVERTIALSEVLAEKCRIYAQGLHRRDNEGEAAHFRALAERAKRLATQPKQVSGLRHWLENVPSIAAQLGGSEGKWHRL
jgi:glycosyltransferase involved in cell wall biosynthesis